VVILWWHSRVRQARERRSSAVNMGAEARAWRSPPGLNLPPAMGDELRRIGAVYTDFNSGISPNCGRTSNFGSPAFRVHLRVVAARGHRDLLHELAVTYHPRRCDVHVYEWNRLCGWQACGSGDRRPDRAAEELDRRLVIAGSGTGQPSLQRTLPRRWSNKRYSIQVGRDGRDIASRRLLSSDFPTIAVV